MLNKGPRGHVPPIIPVFKIGIPFDRWFAAFVIAAGTQMSVNVCVPGG